MLGRTIDTKNSFKVTVAMTRQMDRNSPESTLDQDLLTRLGIKRPHHVTQTPIASIWRVTRADGSYAALKCYFQDDLQDEAPGFDLLTAQNGIGAAKIYARSNAAILMEWLDGPLLGDLTRAGKDEKASQRLLETALTLHHAPVKNIPSLDPLPRRFRALLDAKFTADCPDGIRAAVRKACRWPRICWPISKIFVRFTATCTMITSRPATVVILPLMPKAFWASARSSWQMHFKTHWDPKP